jgi:hypothetical protein
LEENILKVSLISERVREESSLTLGLHKAFIKNKGLTDSEAIEKAINHGRFVYKELEALWFLKKYRAMKQRYSDKERDFELKEWDVILNRK